MIPLTSSKHLSSFGSYILEESALAQGGGAVSGTVERRQATTASASGGPHALQL